LFVAFSKMHDLLLPRAWLAYPYDPKSLAILPIT
jgi:hypothetical protein